MKKIVLTDNIQELLNKLDDVLGRNMEKSLNGRLESVNRFLKKALQVEEVFVAYTPERHYRKDFTKLRTLWDDRFAKKEELETTVMDLTRSHYDKKEVIEEKVDECHFVIAPLSLYNNHVFGTFGIVYQDLKHPLPLVKELLLLTVKRLAAEIYSHSIGLMLYSFSLDLDEACDNVSLNRSIEAALRVYLRYSEVKQIMLLYRDINESYLVEDQTLEFCLMNLEDESPIRTVDPVLGQDMLAKGVDAAHLNQLVKGWQSFKTFPLVNRFMGKPVTFGALTAIDSPYGFDAFYDRQLITILSNRVDSRIVNYHLLKSELCRFIDPRLARHVVEQPQVAVELFKPKRMTVAMLYADMVGFSRFMEECNADVIAEITNLFLVKFQSIVFKHGGIYDKSVGDCGIAIFGVPLLERKELVDEYVSRSIQAAMEIHEEVNKVSAEFLEQIQEPLAASIGIAMGPTLVGLFGPPTARDFTALGKYMNLAAGLQGEAKAGQTIVSEEVFNYLKEHSAPVLFDFSTGESVSLKNMGEKKAYCVTLAK